MCSHDNLRVGQRGFGPFSFPGQHCPQRMAGLLALDSRITASKSPMPRCCSPFPVPDFPVPVGSLRENSLCGGKRLVDLQSRGRLQYGRPNWVHPLHSLLIPWAIARWEPFQLQLIGFGGCCVNQDCDRLMTQFSSADQSQSTARDGRLSHQAPNPLRHDDRIRLRKHRMRQENAF